MPRNSKIVKRGCLRLVITYQSLDFRFKFQRIFSRKKLKLCLWYSVFPPINILNCRSYIILPAPQSLLPNFNLLSEFYLKKIWARFTNNLKKKVLKIWQYVNARLKFFSFFSWCTISGSRMQGIYQFKKEIHTTRMPNKLFFVSYQTSPPRFHLLFYYNYYYK